MTSARLSGPFSSLCENENWFVAPAVLSFCVKQLFDCSIKDVANAKTANRDLGTLQLCMVVIMWQEYVICFMSQFQTSNVDEYLRHLQCWLKLSEVSPDGDLVLMATVEVIYDYRQLWLCVDYGYIVVEIWCPGKHFLLDHWCPLGTCNISLWTHVVQLLSSLNSPTGKLSYWLQQASQINLKFLCAWLSNFLSAWLSCCACWCVIVASDHHLLQSEFDKWDHLPDLAWLEESLVMQYASSWNCINC